MIKSTRSLWVLEDYPELCELMCELGRWKGYETTGLKTIAAAYALFKETLNTGQGIPDLIISDYLLPDGDSEAWMLEVKKAFSNVRLVCVSGSLNQNLVERLQKQGISSQDKPISLAEINQLLG